MLQVKQFEKSNFCSMSTKIKVSDSWPMKERDSLLVNGFIHNHTNKYKMIIIPIEIIDLCIKWYYNDLYFIKVPNCVQIMNDEIITRWWIISKCDLCCEKFYI